MIDDVDEYEGMHGIDWAFSFVKTFFRGWVAITVSGV